MLMYLTMIQDELKGVTADYAELKPQSAGTQGIRQWAPEVGSGDDRYIYIADEKDLKKAETIPSNLIFCSSRTLPELKKNYSANFLAVRSEKTPDELFQTAAAVCEDYSAWDAEMCDSVMREDELAAFMEIAVRKLHNPFGVYDAAQSLIYHSPITKEQAAGTIWEQTLNETYPSLNFFTREEIEYSNREFLASDTPVLINPKRDPEHTYLLGVIRLPNGKQTGSIGMTDIVDPITEGQVQLCRRIAQLLGYIFKTRIRLGMNHYDAYYLKELAAGMNVDERMVDQHLRQQGWTVNDSYYMLAFQMADGFTIAKDGHSYHMRIHRQFPAAQILYFDTLILAVLRHQDNDMSGQEELQRLEDFCEANLMYCGVSNCFHDFMQLHTYYLQASEILKERWRIPSGSRVCSFTSHYVSFLLDSLRRTQNPAVLCDPRILELSRSENKNRFELIDSIRVYLLTGRNMSIAAREMYIHRNTLKYRIQTAEDILNLDFDELDSNETMQILVSCLFVMDEYQEEK